jgi:integrative and conjugative element protein (TIGR02256 family)
MTTLWTDGATLDLVTGAGRAALPRETGGILLGHFADGEPIVTVAPVVPDPSATRIRYRRDAQSAARTLSHQLAADKSGILGYLGEWHTHPLPLGPSRTDRQAISVLATDGGYDVLLLVLALGPGGWRRHGLRGTADGSVKNLDVRVREVQA